MHHRQTPSTYLRHRRGNPQGARPINHNRERPQAGRLALPEANRGPQVCPLFLSAPNVSKKQPTFLPALTGKMQLHKTGGLPPGGGLDADPL